MPPFAPVCVLPRIHSVPTLQKDLFFFEEQVFYYAKICDIVSENHLFYFTGCDYGGIGKGKRICL